MTKTSVEAIVETLNAAGVRYLIAGGLAVVAHGYVRFTADVDLILDLEPDNVMRAIRALDGMGYRPRVPVSLHDFAGVAIRERWARERNMKVFSVYSDEHAATEICRGPPSPARSPGARGAARRRRLATGHHLKVACSPTVVNGIVCRIARLARRRLTDMPKMLIKASYTTEGARGVLKEGGTSRRAAVEKLVTDMGGTMEAFYFAYGEADAFVIVDMPNPVDGLAVSMAVNASGAVRLSTVPLITPEEIDAAAKKTVAYRAPGA